MKLLTDAITGQAKPRNIAAYLREPIKALEFLTTLDSVAGNEYAYVKIWQGTQAVAAGDLLVYDVWIDPMSAAYVGAQIGGLDFAFGAGLAARTYFTDATGANINSGAVERTGGWVTRVIALTAPAVGTDITDIGVVNEGEGVGNSRALYRNIRITDADLLTKLVIWNGGATNVNPPVVGAAGGGITAGYTAWAVTPYDAPSWSGDPGLAAFNFGADTGLRDGIWHDAGMSVFPEVAANGGSEFGVQSGGGFDVELAVTPREFAPTLEYKVTALAGPATNAYSYITIWAGTYAPVAGDVLHYQEWIDPKNPANNWSGLIDVVLNGGANFGRSFALRTQDNYDIYATQPPASKAGFWADRAVKLDAVVGYNITGVDVGNEAATAVGAYRFLYRNIRITNATESVVRVAVWSSGNPQSNSIRFNLNAANASVVVVDAPIAATAEAVSNQVIEFCNTAVGGGNCYAYQSIWTGTVALSAGDLIQFEYWLDPANPAFNTYESCGVQAAHSAGVGGTNVLFTSAQARGVWTAASGPINGGASGGNLTHILLVNESDAAGNHRVLYRNVRITNSTGLDRQVGWRTGTLSNNATIGALLQTVVGINVIDQRLETQAERFDYSAMIANPKPWLGRQFDLEVVSVMNRDGLPYNEITDTRRAVAKTVSRRGNTLKIGFADIDMAALQKTSGTKTYTTVDFPALLPQDVGKPVVDGVGQLVRVPMTFMSTSGGLFYYAICESRAGMTYTLQTIYRGENANDVGRIVPSAEYTAIAASSAYPSGVSYMYVSFAREQVNFGVGGQQYALTADILINAGTGATEARLASNEVARLLSLCGITTDPVSFLAAATYGVTNKMYCDAGYVKPRTFKAIIEDLLMICRCDLTKLSNGAWALVQDSPRAAVATFREDSDEITVDDYAFIDKPATVSLYYKPEVSGDEKWNASPRTRTPGGTLPEKRYQNPYIRNDETADRLCDYLSKRDGIQERATLSAHAVQMAQREVVTVVGNTCWNGSKDWMIDTVRRPADKNVLAVRLYDAAIYTYTAATLPTDTTGVYSPDYSNTPPTAPAWYGLIANDVALDSSGKAFSSVLLAATPPSPSINWVSIFGSIKNNVTGEITVTAEWVFDTGTYKTTVGRLQPNTSHTVTLWAVNGSGLKGATDTSGAFNTSNYATAPATPSTPVATIGLGHGVELYTATPTYAHHKRCEWERDIGGYGFASMVGIVDAQWVDTATLSYGNTYTWRVRYVDDSGNVSAWATSAGLIPTVQVDDSHIIGSGVNAASIGSGSVNSSRTNSTAGSYSIVVSPTYWADFAPGAYSFAVVVRDTTALGVPEEPCTMLANSYSTSNDGGVAMKNNGTVNHGITFYYRYLA